MNYTHCAGCSILSFGTPIYVFYFAIACLVLDVCEIGVTDVCVSLFLSEFFCFNQHYMEFKEDAERKIRGLEENLASQLNQELCNKKKKEKVRLQSV